MTELKNLFNDETLRYKAYVRDKLISFAFKIIGLINTTIAAFAALVGFPI